MRTSVALDPERSASWSPAILEGSNWTGARVGGRVDQENGGLLNVHLDVRVSNSTGSSHSTWTRGYSANTVHSTGILRMTEMTHLHNCNRKPRILPGSNAV